MIPFNKPPYVGNEMTHIQKAIQNCKICGDGEFTKLCNNWIEVETGTRKALLTTSCTHALEMAAMLCGIREGDEVIMPSYTFVSTANAFVRSGARIRFVDIRPDTMNIDETMIEKAITAKTKAIVPVHYAGVSCEMDAIMEIAKKHNLLVVEDAAQGVMSGYNGRPLGTIGDFGCYSFHETKNYSMGEGGALLVNNERYIERAEIIREKGTNRKLFLRGEVDKYTWVDEGSSYLPSDINAAYLWAQLQCAKKINEARLLSYEQYESGLDYIKNTYGLELPVVPLHCQHNAHMFFIKAKDLEQRTRFIEFMKTRGIQTTFHYVPLHASIAGLRFGVFSGHDIYTTKESERLVRLPMFYGLTREDVSTVLDSVQEFYMSDRDAEKALRHS